MLETVREFGCQQLADHGEEIASRNRHAAYFRALVEELNAGKGAFLPNAQQVFDLLELDYPNLRSAMLWLRETGDLSAYLELAGSLYHFWQLRGHLCDGRALLDWGIAQEGGDSSARASAGLALAGIRYWQFEHESALALCEASRDFYWVRGDAAGIALTCDLAVHLTNELEQHDRSVAFIEEALAALATIADCPWALRATSHVLFYRGIAPLVQGDWAAAEEYFLEATRRQEALAQESGQDHSYACWPLKFLGIIASMRGDRPLAMARYQGSLRHAWKSHEARCCAHMLGGVAGTLTAVGRWEEAAILFGAAEAFCERIGLAFRYQVFEGHHNLKLPEPWPGGAELLPGGLGGAGGVLPPIVDPVVVAERWALGRGVEIEDAVAMALAVDLAEAPVLELGGGVVPPQSLPAKPILSEREQDVLALLCERLTDRQIATQLFLSPRTIEAHVSHILGKLGVDNRRDAAASAVRRGLV